MSMKTNPWSLYSVKVLEKVRILIHIYERRHAFALPWFLFLLIQILSDLTFNVHFFFFF